MKIIVGGGKSRLKFAKCRKPLHLIVILTGGTLLLFYSLCYLLLKLASCEPLDRTRGEWQTSLGVKYNLILRSFSR